MLTIALAALFGVTLSGSATATTPPPAHGVHIASRAMPMSTRTGLPLGVLPTHAQLARAARTNATSLQGAALQQTTATNNHLTYYGGPVVSNVQVQPVEWGTASTYIPEITNTTGPTMQSFLQTVAASPYLGSLSEYGTSSQTIGAGTVSPGVTITPATPASSGTTLYDSDVQQELFNQIFNDTTGPLYMPTQDTAHLAQLANTTYTLYFPAGVTLCQDNSTACSNNTFCGYHSHFSVVDSSNTPIANVRYIVLPDPTTSGWLGGCSSNGATTDFTALQSVASHELSEVITDPEVGYHTAWYDANPAPAPFTGDMGEIADICETVQYPNQSTPYRGTDGQAYVLQNVWSNHRGACVPTRPSPKLISPTNVITLAGSTAITYSATDGNVPTGITYDVAYKSAAWNRAWAPLTTIVHGTSATRATLPLHAGTEYCFVVRAHDALGIVSGWSSPRCTTSPLDDASLSTKTTGWTRARVSAAYHGTVTRTGKVGSKLAVGGAITNELGLVVTTCPTCGSVQIYLGNTLWKTISTKSSTLHYKQVRLPGTFSRRTTGIVIRDASGLVIIDGLGVVRQAPRF